MDTTRKQWKSDLIEGAVLPHEAVMIKNIPLSKGRSNDVLM